MITSTTSPASERRIRTRQLSGITTASYSDADLDMKIEAADSITTSLFGGIPSDATRLENFITVSNAKTAYLILMGFGAGAEMDRAIELRHMCKEIVEASNGRLMQQHKPTVRVTHGMTPGAYGFNQ